MAVIEAIATQYLEATASSVTFSSIPQTYLHLELRTSAKTDWNNTSTPSYGAIQLNGDTTAKYGYRRTVGGYGGSGTGIAGDIASGQSSYSYVGRWTNEDDGWNGAGFFNAMNMTFWDYASTNKKMTLSALSLSNGPHAYPQSLSLIQMDGGFFNDFAAITSIGITMSGGSNFLRGSEFTLYGIKDS